jgi:membrane-bound lytic murein transglycosylase MltF
MRRWGVLTLLAVALLQNPSPSLSQTTSYSDTTDSRAVSAVVLNYDQDPAFVQRLVSLAEKYAYSDFPRKEDILAIIAVESRFRPDAKTVTSKGLMQINLEANHKRVQGSLFNPEENIRVGVEILRGYYELLGDNRNAAIMAYNIGPGSYIKGRRSRAYLSKVEKNARLIYPVERENTVE